MPKDERGVELGQIGQVQISKKIHGGVLGVIEMPLDQVARQTPATVRDLDQAADHLDPV